MKKTDLIFHLGLTKCASSFIQQRILFGKMNTLARSVQWKKDQVQALEFQELFLNSDANMWRDYGLEYFKKFDSNPELGPVIISHESLYEHIPFGGAHRPKNEPNLIGSRLHAISEHAWPHGDTKAFFFFRRQPDWLTSIYAQTCFLLPNPSQVDFEKRAEEFLDSGENASHVIEYDALIECLERSLGPTNVLALPYEAIGEEWVWEKVREFTGDDRFHRDKQMDIREVNVKRGMEESDWMMNDHVQVVEKISKISKNFGVHFLPRTFKDKIRGKIRDLTERRVYCPKWLDEKAKNRYLQSNRRLSNIIDVELGSYGYH